MAITIARVTDADHTEGNRRRRVRSITFDSSYPTGGEALIPSDVGLKVITEAIPHGMFRKTSDGSDAIAVSYSVSGQKLFAYRQKDPANAGGADIAFPEVGNTIDLSGYSGKITFIGW